MANVRRVVQSKVNRQKTFLLFCTLNHLPFTDNKKPKRNPPGHKYCSPAQVPTSDESDEDEEPKRKEIKNQEPKRIKEQGQGQRTVEK